MMKIENFDKYFNHITNLYEFSKEDFEEILKNVAPNQKGITENGLKILKVMKNNCESCAPKGREFFYSVKLVVRFMNGDGYGGIDSESNPLKLVYCPECGRKISEVSADEQ